MCNTNETSATPVIVGGKLRTLGIVRPNAQTILRLATAATLDGFGLSGDGPIRRVTGSRITIIVGPTGCSCPLWRNGEFCAHAALWIVEMGMVGLPPAPCDRHRGSEPPQRLTGRDRRMLYRLSRDRQSRRRWPVRAYVTAATDDESDELAA